jgi:hypothetical protein
LKLARKALLLFFALAALSACNKTTTSIPLSWKNPNYQSGGFQKIFVIGIGESEGTRRSFEDAFAKAIAREGAAAQASWGFLPQSEALTEEQIRYAIEGGDFDGVVITRLMGVDQTQEYVRPSTRTVPSARSGYYGFYGTSYTMVHEPGYFKTNTRFRLETNLYSVATGDLVWSGQSATLNPESINDVIASMTAAVAKKLKAEKLIP